MLSQSATAPASGPSRSSGEANLPPVRDTIGWVESRLARRAAARSSPWVSTAVVLWTQSAIRHDFTVEPPGREPHPAREAVELEGLHGGCGGELLERPGRGREPALDRPVTALGRGLQEAHLGLDARVRPAAATPCRRSRSKAAADPSA